MISITRFYIKPSALALVLIILIAVLSGCKSGNETASLSSKAKSTLSASSVASAEPESSADASADSSAAGSAVSTAPASSSVSSAKQSASSKAVPQSSAQSQAVSSKAAEVSDKLTLANIYDIKNVTGKLAVWFFEMPSDEEHTGDCMLIRTPSGKTVLVDSGTDGGAKQVLTYLSSLGITSLDYIIATHMHVDHIGGFPRILKTLSAKECYGTTYTSYSTSAVSSFLTTLQSKNIPYKRATKGTVINLESNISIEILYPDGDFPANQPTDNVGLNNTSVTFLLTYGTTRFLFTGDIMFEVEMKLLDEMPEKLKCDVIKIPHHGSTGSSTTAFLKKTGAKYGVTCTATFNDRGVFDTYKLLEIDPMYTSLVGTVLMVSDGAGIKYAQQKK